MESLNLDFNKRYTFADYLTWLDDVRRELYDGFIKLMSPSPTLNHQRVLRKLTREVDDYLINKKCEVFFAPSDVRLPNNKDKKSDKQIYTVVQPDLYIVCNPQKLDQQGCLGAPDMIIEIVSPKNADHDIKYKYKIYEKHGVTEYWIVNPNDENVNVFILDEKSEYKLVGMYAGDDKIPVNIFDGKLKVDLTKVFDAPVSQ